MPANTGLVTFADVLPTFRSMYGDFFPEDKYPDSMLLGFFIRATIIGPKNMNCAWGPTYDERVVYYAMLMAHLLWLRNRGKSGLVGFLTSASQGSVSMGVQPPLQRPGKEFYDQSPFGQEYWEATRKWRHFVYVSPPWFTWK